MIKKISLFLLVSILFLGHIRADEGMWIPMLLKKYNIEDMQQKGFKLTAEDIYSVNQASMKDAVMIFGGGCTGELISDQGLLITNHHCGYGAIQRHSSVENDYLTDGFWAMSADEELPNQGLSVTFLIRMEDVSERVLAVVDDNMNQRQRNAAIGQVVSEIENEASENGKYSTKVKPFYYGNEFYLFVQEVFSDVRLVGAPPSAIGKFGGDTDNWMWPRHTGDFSIFRIYADQNNQPAQYAADNKPYKPRKHFPISTKGVKQDDFTLVFGYPGSTEQYLTSYAVEMLMNQENPHKINLRQKRIDVMSAAMNASPKVRIQYASKYARVSNAWKKWIGESRGLRRLDAISKKQEQEKIFTQWAADKPAYKNLLPTYKSTYEQIAPYNLALNYIFEAALAMEIVNFARNFSEIPVADQSDYANLATKLQSTVEGHFKDYHEPIDREIFAILLKEYGQNMDKPFLPEFYETINGKFKGDYDKYTDWVYGKTMFNDKNELLDFLDGLNSKSVKKLSKDPVYEIFDQFVGIYRNIIYPGFDQQQATLDSMNRLYMRGLMEMQPDKLLFPDANFTLRVAYGKVSGSEPYDGMTYKYYTTLAGIIDKDNPDIYDYRVPKKLKDLYASKDYGRWGENGEMHVCFLATNHTTGGNSGSPVINADGHLIGVNFDRSWESTMSDIMFDPEQCRNITLDIRYALFIIDKFAGAGYLIDEMTLVE